nr:FMN-dependent NADH-azoreductase [Haemophilus influenzae]PRK32413.1 FMN-dependent NADH-azoreductase [Haemophilus influenzae]
MSNVLVLKSSISGNNSQTNQLVDYAVEKLQGNNIIVRDLSQQPLPYFDTVAAIAAWGTKNNRRKTTSGVV